MNDWRIIRIAVALAVIFACGVIVGRVTAPGGGSPSLAGRPVFPRGGRVQNPEAMLARMADELKLTPEQLAQVRPLVKQWAEEAAPMAPQSPERHAVAERYLARIRPLLRAEQLPDFDRAVEQSRRRLNSR